MAIVIADRIKETSTTGGAGTLTMAGAVAKFRLFSAVCANGDTVPYLIEHTSAAEWEVGIGSWGTGSILTRSKVLASSTGSLVTFSAGTCEISLSPNAIAVANNSTVTGIAAAGSVQGTAAALSARHNVVTSATVGSADGVIMPSAVRLKAMTVVNRSTAIIKAYPASGETVAGLSANAPISINPGLSYQFSVAVDGAWIIAGVNIWDDSNSAIVIPVHASKPTANAAAPALFMYDNGGLPLPALSWSGSNVPIPWQNNIGKIKFRAFFPMGYSVGVGAIGYGSITTIGSLSGRSITQTNIATLQRRLGSISSATAGSICGNYDNAVNAYPPNAFYNYLHSIQRVIVADAATVSGARMFVGLQSGSAAPTNVEPNTLGNCIGFAQLSTDATQWYFVYGGTTPQTAIALGTAIGAPTLTDTAWDCIITIKPNVINSSCLVTYKLINLGTGVEVTGSISDGGSAVIFPTTSIALGQRMWRCNNATALSVGLDFCGSYLETNC